MGTYKALGDLGLNAFKNFVETTPLVLVLGAAANDAERLKDVDDVVDAAALHSQLLGAGVEQEDSLALDAVVVEETPAQFAQRLFFARIYARGLGGGHSSALTLRKGRLQIAETVARLALGVGDVEEALEGVGRVFDPGLFSARFGHKFLRGEVSQKICEIVSKKFE